MFHGLTKNRAKVNAAREALAKLSAVPYADRIERHRKRTGEEEASRAGVVTINQAEVTFIELNMWAYDNFGESFIESTDLQFGQQAVYKTRLRRPVRVNLGNLAGTPPGFNFATVQNHVDVPTFEYFSEEIMVPNLVNTAYNLEAFKEKEQALLQLAHNMRLFRQKLIINMMLGAALTTPIATSIPAYAASSPFNGRLPYVLDAEIASGSVPTTNVLSNTSEGGLTKGVFKSQRTWANQMDRELVTMYVPVSGAPWEATWDQASIVGYSAGGNSNLDTSKAVTPAKWAEAEALSFKKNGAQMNWFGSSIFVQPVNILPAGYALIGTTEPAVLGWNKLTDAVSDEERIAGTRNMNRRYEKRSIGLAQPDPFLTHFLVQRFA